MLSSSAVGYSVGERGVKEGVALVPLLEKLVQLVERRGADGLAVEELEEGEWYYTWVYITMDQIDLSWAQLGRQ